MEKRTKAERAGLTKSKIKGIINTLIVTCALVQETDYSPREIALAVEYEMNILQQKIGIPDDMVDKYGKDNNYPGSPVTIELMNALSQAESEFKK